jgi:ribosomal protein S18 acetylase RimI-like enzyme
LNFRAAAAADIPALAALLLWATPGRTLEHELAYVRGYFERPETVVTLAEQDGELAGVVSFEPSLIRGEPVADARTGYVRLLAVDPDLWGTGLASELMAQARSEMAGDGFDRAYLWCGASNARARRFYEREGWTLDGREREHADWGRMISYQRRISDAAMHAARQV